MSRLTVSQTRELAERLGLRIEKVQGREEWLVRDLFTDVRVAKSLTFRSVVVLLQKEADSKWQKWEAKGAAVLDQAEQDAIRQVLRRDEKEHFLDKFERDLLKQILRRHSGSPPAGAASASGESPQK